MAHWMRDELDAAHAVFLLKAAEYAGPFCRPPELLPCHHRHGLARPLWLAMGTAAAALEYQFEDWESRESYTLCQYLGGVPPRDLAFNRAVEHRPRAHDPNAGVPTCDACDSEQTGYQDPYYEDEAGDFQTRDLFEDLSDTYIGGTMHTSQAIPRFSPYHLGFPEEFGGCKFGDGCAQLDFKDFKIDWACG